MSNQIPLPLGTSVSYDQNQFLITPSHAAVLSTMAAPDAWPQGKLVIVGPRASGKTHLLHMQAAQAGLSVLAPMGGPTSGHALAIVDDADSVAGHPEAEEWLFHLHNNTLGAGGRLLLSARSAPARWGNLTTK